MWEFVALADRIESNRVTKYRRNPVTGRRRKCKVDYMHRLLYVLQWLNEGRDLKKMRCQSGWSKSSLAEDIPHVLRAIIAGLDNEI